MKEVIVLPQRVSTVIGVHYVQLKNKMVVDIFKN